MSMRKLAFAALLLAAPAAQAESPNLGPNLGRPATPAEVAGWDISIAPDGKTLPKGSGSVPQGAAVFARACEACHGAAGSGGPIQIPLVGGVGTLASAKPVRTVASYWPYATTLFDYVRRAMPYVAPQSLTDSEIYAVSAYLLSIDGIVAKDAVLDAKSLPRVKMPNANGFITAWPEPR